MLVYNKSMYKINTDKFSVIVHQIPKLFYYCGYLDSYYILSSLQIFIYIKCVNKIIIVKR